MFRSVADVVLKADLRGYLEAAAHPRRPAAARSRPRRARRSGPTSASGASGSRRSRTEAAAPQKGDDILLSVITDGRHAAIDMRLVWPGNDNEPDNKLNKLIANVHRIWAGDRRATATRRPDGTPYPIPGAGQLIFSDLGTLSVEATRGFSAYRWIRQELVRLGVPAVRDRLHAGLQEVGGQAAPVQRLQCRPRPHPDRLVGDDGHRRQRAAAAEGAAPSRRAVAAVADRAARGPDRAAGQPARRDRDLRLRDARLDGRHDVAEQRAQGPLHRRGAVRRPQHPHASRMSAARPTSSPWPRRSRRATAG